MPYVPRRFVRDVPRVMSANDIARASRSDLDESLANVGGLASFPSDTQKAARLAEKAAQDHFQDAQDYAPSWSLMPMGLVSDVTADLGSSTAGRIAARGLWGSMLASPDKAYTNKLNNTATGRAPTIMYNGSIGTHTTATNPATDDARLGIGSDVAVTKITPWQIADGITGSKPRSDELLTRIAERNLPGGMDGATVYHLENLPKNWNRPWLVFRDMADGFKPLDGSGRQGFADPLSKQIYLNRSGDPYATNFGSKGQFNVGLHELIHSLLDGVNPSQSFKMGQRYRPAVLDTKRDVPGQGGYFQQDADEMSNLIWQLKRQTEITNPSMRDVGATRSDSDAWLDHVRRYNATGSDPLIDLPGHRQQGQPAHGYDQGMQWLQQILDAAGKEGSRDIGDINWKLGQSSPLKTALLA